MMLQLNLQIPVTTPRGPGVALIVFDYSAEHHLLWVIALDETGEIWAFQNPEIRLRNNPSMGRNLDPT